MSTKIRLSRYSDPTERGGWLRLHRENFDPDDRFVYLETGGGPLDAVTSVDLSGNGLSTITVRIPNEWAGKLGLSVGSSATNVD